MDVGDASMLPIRGMKDQCERSCLTFSGSSVYIHGDTPLGTPCSEGPKILITRSSRPAPPPPRSRSASPRAGILQHIFLPGIQHMPPLRLSPATSATRDPNRGVLARHRTRLLPHSPRCLPTPHQTVTRRPISHATWPYRRHGCRKGVARPGWRCVWRVRGCVGNDWSGERRGGCI